MPAHLDERTAALVGGSVQARVNWVFRKHVIRHAAWCDAERVLLDALYRREGEPARTILLTGPEGTGKTALLDSLMPEHGQPYVSDNNEPVKPIVWPADPIADYSSYLGNAILDRFHGGFSARDDPVEGAIQFLGKVCSVQLLVLDELWDNPSDEMMGAIERFRTEAGTSIVLTSQRAAKSGDAWAAKAPGRTHVRLPEWTPGAGLAQLLDKLEAGMPLPRDCATAAE